MNTKEFSLFSDIMLLFSNGYHGNNKNITVVFQMCQTIHPHVRISSTDGNIRNWLLLNCAFIIYHAFITICCSSVFAELLKNNIFGFSVVFLVKLFTSRSLKLNISRTAWPILMILVSFCRILDGLSDEINLFWSCSSPLRMLATLSPDI